MKEKLENFFAKLILGKNEHLDFIDYIKKTYKNIIHSQVMKVDMLSILFFVGKWLPFAIAIGITTGVIASFMDLLIVYINKYLNTNIIYLFIYPFIVSVITGFALNQDSKIGGPGIGFAVLHLKTPFYLKIKTLLLKLIVSIFTLSGGFIAGREGPSFFLGVGLGEWLGKAYGFSRKFKNMLGLIGGGAFTGALLKAPLGSSIFAMELENTYDFDYRPFVPMIVASITSYLTFSFFRGNHAFINLVKKPIWYLNDIPYIILMGIVISIIIYVYTITFHFLQKTSRIIPVNRRPLIGTLISIPFLIGIYYSTNNIDILSAPANMEILSNLAQNHFTIKMDIAFILYTIVITSFTLAFGIPGGLVLPVLIIGAAVGNIFGNYFPDEITMFTLAGMGAALSAAAKTPLAAIVMITEMSHDDVVIPMTAAVITSYLTSFGYSLYLGLENPFRGDLKSLHSHMKNKNA
jgi:CIC family chloride channel protein